MDCNGTVGYCTVDRQYVSFVQLSSAACLATGFPIASVVFVYALNTLPLALILVSASL